MGIIITCCKCRQSIQTNITWELIRNWQSGKLIQDAMPNIPITERELLLSGYCDSCFKAITSDEVEY